MLMTVLLILLLVLLVGGLPTWQWHSLGYTPSGVVTIVLIVVVVLMLTGRL